MKDKDLFNKIDKQNVNFNYKRSRMDTLKYRKTVVDILTVILGAFSILFSFIPFYINKSFILFTDMGDYHFFVITSLLLSVIYLAFVIGLVFMVREYSFKKLFKGNKDYWLIYQGREDVKRKRRLNQK